MQPATTRKVPASTPADVVSKRSYLGKSYIDILLLNHTCFSNRTFISLAMPFSRRNRYVTRNGKEQELYEGRSTLSDTFAFSDVFALNCRTNLSVSVRQ